MVTIFYLNNQEEIIDIIVYGIEGLSTSIFHKNCLRYYNEDQFSLYLGDFGEEFNYDNHI